VPAHQGDSLANSVIFPRSRPTETRDLAAPSLGGENDNSVTFSRAGVDYVPAQPAGSPGASICSRFWAMVSR